MENKQKNILKTTHKNDSKAHRIAFLAVCIVLLTSILGVSLVSAWSNTTFNDSVSAANLTYTTVGNQTRWLEIPDGTLITNAVIKLIGYNQTLFPTYPFIDVGNDSVIEWRYSPLGKTDYHKVSDDEFSNSDNTGNWSNYTTAGASIFENTEYLRLNSKSASGNVWSEVISNGTGALDYYTGYDVIIELNLTINLTTSAVSSMETKWGLTDAGGNTVWMNETVFDSTDAIEVRDISVYRLEIDESEKTLNLYDDGTLVGENIDISSLGNNYYIIGWANKSLEGANSNDGAFIDFNHLRSNTGQLNATENIIESDLGFGINSYLDTCTPIGGYCQVPFVFHSDTAGNLSYSEMSFDNAGGFLENSQTFNSETMEGATEIFGLNITKNNSLTVSSINLVYNGTSYSFPYSVSGNEIVAEDSITIPSLDTESNLSFYWNITFTDSTSETTITNNQTVKILNVDNCSSYSNVIYNFTQYDEETKTLLDNGTIEVQFNLYDLSKTINLINFSQKSKNTNPVQICLEESLLTTVNYSSYVDIKYFSNETDTNTSYSVEHYHILNQTLTNNTVPNEISLYSLKESDTTQFRLTFRDSSYNLAPNILVQIHRQYIEDNDFKIVEIPLTDSNGQTILNLVRNEVIYNLIMVNEAGETVATFNSVKAFCQDYTIGECTINLNAEPSIEEVYNYDEYFGISITEPSYSNTTGLVSLSFVTADLLPKTVRMEIVRNNDFGNRSVCSNSLTSASGTLTCDVSSIRDTDQFLFIDVYVDGELFAQYTINLFATTLRFSIVNGAFYAFLIVLFMICLFMEDRRMLLISLMLGWVTVISLGLMNGKFIGAGSAGIWALVSISLFLWKLNKEES